MIKNELGPVKCDNCGSENLEKVYSTLMNMPLMFLREYICKECDNHITINEFIDTKSKKWVRGQSSTYGRNIR